jgi:hypothetical protein
MNESYIQQIENQERARMADYSEQSGSSSLLMSNADFASAIFLNS